MSPIEFSCSCGKQIAVPAGAAGKTGRCPACGATLVVPPLSPSSRRPPFIPTPESASEQPPRRTGGSAPEDVETVLSLRPGPSIGVLLQSEPAVSLRGGPESPSPQAPKYTISERLGRGGMGEVWGAVDRDLRREVAIKTLLSPHRPDLLYRFIEEAQVTGQLEHPNIVPVHELAVDPETGRPLLVMKRVRGRTLREVLDGLRGGEKTGLGSRVEMPLSPPLPGKERSHRRPGRRSSAQLPAYGSRGESSKEGLTRLLGVFLKVCDAIGYAHSRGVIHRDLKPDNVMTGEFGEVLVMDWGLAKMVGRTDTADSSVSAARVPVPAGRTAAGAVIGTPMYMAPEQASGLTDALDERTDIYGLGALLYEILSLSPPLQARDSEAALAMAARGEFRPPSQRLRAPWTIPRDLEAVVLKAMAFKPGSRYHSVAGLKGDIEAFLAGRALGAAEYSSWARLAKWARRRKPIVAGAAAALLVAFIGFVGMATSTSRAKDREAAARRMEAEELFERGSQRWQAAARDHAFNPADPQSYFQAHLPGLIEMGTALRSHPDADREWRRAVAEAALTLQERAEAISDWSLARVLAECAHALGAVDAEQRDLRLARTARTEADTAERDRKRLAEVLERIREAQKSPPKGDSPEKQGALLPGEVEERARRLTQQTQPGVTREIIGLLREVEAPHLDLGRLFLIELLGRKGNTIHECSGITAPQLVLDALREYGSRKCRLPWIEAPVWIMAGVRLEARFPGSLSGLQAELAQITEAQASNPYVTSAVRRAYQILAILGGSAPLSSPVDSPEDFRFQVGELGEWAARQVRSGTEYTRELLRLAQGRSTLSEAETCFVLDAIGLHGDTQIPPMHAGGAAPVDLLCSIFGELPDEWAEDARPPHVSDATWKRARTAAVKAAENLSRLGDGSIAKHLNRLRWRSGPSSVFAASTGVAFKLMPLEKWPPPRTAPEHDELGMALRAQLEFESAAAEFTRAIDCDPRFAPAWKNRAWCRVVLGDREGGLADSDAALRIDSNYALAYVNRASIHWVMGDVEAAIEDSHRALESDPRNRVAHENLATYMARSGDIRGAIEQCTLAINADLGSGKIFGIRGAYRTEVGDIEGGIQDLSRLIERDPNNAAAYKDRAKAWCAKKDAVRAAADAERAIQLAPTDADTWVRLGDAWRESGNRELAIEAYSIAIDLDASYYEAYVNRSIAQWPSDLQGAIDDLTRAIEIRPRALAAYFNRGLAFAQREDYQAAMEDFTSAIRLRPEYALAYTNRGAVRAQSGDLDGAIEDYSHALSLDPEQALALGNRADAWLKKGDPEQALRDADAALAVDRELWIAWENRGDALKELGSDDLAAEAYEEALRFCPAKKRADIAEKRDQARAR